MWPPQPRPLAIVWLRFGWPGCKMAIAKGYPGPACGIGLMGWQGTLSLALRSGGRGSQMSCLWGEESCPRAVQGHSRQGCGVSLTPQVTEQVGAD